MQKTLSQAVSSLFQRSGILAVALMLTMSFLPSRHLLAQAATGTITGRVTDSTGAVSASTPVTLTRTDTGLVLSSVTNGDGIYAFPSLQTGPYVVKISHPGFKAVKASITLGVSQNRTGGSCAADR